MSFLAHPVILKDIHSEEIKLTKVLMKSLLVIIVLNY